MPKSERKGPDYGKRAFSENKGQSLDIRALVGEVKELRERLDRLSKSRIEDASRKVKQYHVAWGVKHDEVSARLIPVIDSGGYFDSTTVEDILQEYGSRPQMLFNTGGDDVSGHEMYDNTGGAAVPEKRIYDNTGGSHVR